MVNVRQATEQDYIPMAILIRDFFDENKFADLDIKLDLDSGISLAMRLTKEHIMLVLESNGHIVGGIGGTIMPFPLNNNMKIFMEAFFYVREGFKKHSHLLLKELEKKCKELGLNKIIMAYPADENLEKMSRFYKAKGYKKLEMHFIRGID